MIPKGPKPLGWLQSPRREPPSLVRPILQGLGEPDRADALLAREVRDRVRIQLYDVAGQLVRTLADGQYSPGVHSLSWDGTARGGNTLAAGVYFCQLDGGSERRTSKLIVLP